MAAKEMVLYYQPAKEKEAGNASKAAKLKGVLIRMGVRIKNITPEQTGFDGFDEMEPQEGSVAPEIDEEMLVMKNFTNRRIDELLVGLRRAGVPKIELKAVVTETNCGWSFYALYEELKKEREAMTKKEED